MMVLNNIGIVQSDGAYHLFTENNLYLGGVRLPDNGQLMHDAKTLELVTKAIALRWGLIDPPKKR